MKIRIACALVALSPVLASAAGPWQEISMPTVAEAAAAFQQPPKEFGAIHWATGFPPARQRIISDIENLQANGGSVYMINAGGRSVKFLSPEYFDLVKVATEELKKHGMKMWIDGDCGYPDGFAGGLISKLYPQLGMQGIVADARFIVAGGQTLSIPMPVDTLGILTNLHQDIAQPPLPAPVAPGAARGARRGGRNAQAAPASAPANQALEMPANGQFKWTAPTGGIWYVFFDGSTGEARYSVASGQTLTIPLPVGTKSIRTEVRSDWRPGQPERRPGGPATTVVPMPADGQFKWTAPADGTYEVTFVRHVYRSSPTRFGQREDGTRDKDSLYSLIDYLDADATAAYIKLVPEEYGKYVGDEFGKTILGFRGDETDYTGFIPWTPKLLETFQKQKGYDLKPYIAAFFGSSLTPQAQRVRADYFDVWSGMFRDNFFKPMEEWCRAHGMDYMMHLNHEEAMLRDTGYESMTENEGSFFRDMRYMGVPGVDNLTQVRPGIVADFPKLAGSAAHLFGRPQAWTEEGGNLGQNGKFVVDYQLVRGINFMNIRGLNSPPVAADAVDPADMTGWYVTRAQYLMTIGRPAAQVALYHPSDSFWLDDREADSDNVKLTTELMEHQIDFDHIDHDALASVCTLEKDGLKNLSGQVYRAVIIPTSTVIQKNVLDRLRAFAAGGGKVIFVGRTPSMLVDRTFLDAGPAPDLSFATVIEPTAEITDRVITALPKPDVKLDTACPPIKYMHRSLKDGEIYFFFNESSQAQTRTATVAGKGQVQVWDAASGKIQPLAGATVGNGKVTIPLALGPQESRFIVITPQANGAARP